MPFTIDFLDDDRFLECDATANGAVVTKRDNYTPRFYVASLSPIVDIDLTALRKLYGHHPDIVVVEVVSRRPDFCRNDECVLAVDVNHTDRVTTLAWQA